MRDITKMNKYAKMIRDDDRITNYVDAWERLKNTQTEYRNNLHEVLDILQTTLKDLISSKRVFLAKKERLKENNFTGDMDIALCQKGVGIKHYWSHRFGNFRPINLLVAKDFIINNRDKLSEGCKVSDRFQNRLNNVIDALEILPDEKVDISKEFTLSKSYTVNIVSSGGESEYDTCRIDLVNTRDKWNGIVSVIVSKGYKSRKMLDQTISDKQHIHFCHLYPEITKDIESVIDGIELKMSSLEAFKKSDEFKKVISHYKRMVVKDSI